MRGGQILRNRNFVWAFVLNFSVMKRQILAIALVVALLPVSGFAQGQRDKGFDRGRFARLSMDERAKLRSAHQAAISDPAVAESRQRFKQARKDFREKLRDALLKADPSVQPILEKVRRKPHEER